MESHVCELVGAEGAMADWLALVAGWSVASAGTDMAVAVEIVWVTPDLNPKGNSHLA